MQLKPSEIFYSQDSINNIFDKNCSHAGRLIGDTLDDICEGRCSVYSIPTIRVVNRNDKWVTCDNRRLWVFRHLERLGKVDEVPVQLTSYIPSLKMTSVNGGRDITVRRNAGGYWRNRPSKRQDPPQARATQSSRKIYDSESPLPQQTYKSTATRPQNYTPPNIQHTNWANRRDTSVGMAPTVATHTSPSIYGYSSGAYQPQYPAYTAEIQRPTQNTSNLPDTSYSTTSSGSTGVIGSNRAGYDAFDSHYYRQQSKPSPKIDTTRPSAMESYHIKTETPSVRQNPKPPMKIETKRPSVVDSCHISIETPSAARQSDTAIRVEDDDGLWSTRRQTAPSGRRPLTERWNEVEEEPCRCCVIL